MEEGRFGPLTGGIDVSDFRQGGANWPGGPPLGKELPSLAGSSDRSEAGNSRLPHHFSGDETDAWNRPPGAWHAQGCARGSPPREHQDDGRCLYADYREQCSRRDELQDQADPRRQGKTGRIKVEDAGSKGSRTESEEIGFRGCAAIGPSWTKF